MCGIGGVIGRSDPIAGETLITNLDHRGPDGSTLWMEASTTLVHTRLAIVDLTDTGSQPFFSRSGRYVLVYNGEIYNHLELRERYSIDASGCDGAVLPELWEKLGQECLGVLRGMYALAVYDRDTDETWLAVDPLGIKTLYLKIIDEAVIFGSEAVAVAATAGTSDVEPDAPELFQSWGCLPADRSGMDGIARMPPGRVVRFDKQGTLHEESDVDTTVWRSTPTTWADVTRHFVESVEMHLRADVPIGLLLSAGVDSSSIAWAAAELGTKLDCFTLNLPGVASEGPIASKTASAFGHSHHVIEAGPHIEKDLQTFLQRVDRPTSDGANTYLVSAAMRRQGLKVALTGVGADEVLLGYGHHQQRALRFTPDGPVRSSSRYLLDLQSRYGPWAQRPGSTSNRYQELLVAGLGSYARRGTTTLPSEQVKRARAQTLDFADSAGCFVGPSFEPLAPSSRRSSIAEAEWRYYLVPTLLADADIFSMAVGLELRTPFVDLGFISSVLNNPDPRSGKHHFVDATGSPVLREIAERPKTGFNVPYSSWLREFGLQRSISDRALASRLAEVEIPMTAARRGVEDWKQLMWSAWLDRLPRGGSRTTTDLDAV